MIGLHRTTLAGTDWSVPGVFIWIGKNGMWYWHLGCEMWVKMRFLHTEGMASSNKLEFLVATGKELKVPK